MHKITPLNSDMTEGPGAVGPIYPMLYIKERDLPGIKKKEIDDEYKIVLKVKQRAVRKLRGGEIEAEVDITEIGLMGSKADA